VPSGCPTADRPSRKGWCDPGEPASSQSRGSH
jgi:hypothetical protein